jgi:hypothetical protein
MERMTEQHPDRSLERINISVNTSSTTKYKRRTTVTEPGCPSLMHLCFHELSFLF